MAEFTDQISKARREHIRWYLLVSVNIPRPSGVYAEALLPVIQATYPNATLVEVQRELSYLAERHLVKVTRNPRWYVEMERRGVDIVEYTVECAAGVARPRCR